MNNIVMYNNENICLTFTSVFLILPGIYGLYFNETIFSSLIVMSSIISYNFWINPKYDIYRIIDLVYTRTNTLLFLVYNLYLNHKYYYVLLHIHIIIQLIWTMAYISYLIATTCYDKKYTFWFIFHMSAHFFVILGNFTFVNLVIFYNNDEKNILTY